MPPIWLAKARSFDDKYLAHPRTLWSRTVIRGVEGRCAPAARGSTRAGCSLLSCCPPQLLPATAPATPCSAAASTNARKWRKNRWGTTRSSSDPSPRSVEKSMPPWHRESQQEKMMIDDKVLEHFLQIWMGSPVFWEPFSGGNLGAETGTAWTVPQIGCIWTEPGQAESSGAFQQSQAMWVTNDTRRDTITETETSLVAQCEIPPPIAQYPFEIVSQRGVSHPFALFYIWYRASIAEIPLLRGGYRTSTSHALQGGNAQKRGRGYRTQVAMLRHQKPHSAQ